MRVGSSPRDGGTSRCSSTSSRASSGLDFEDVQLLSPEYTQDQTDLHDQPEEERGGWVRVKNQCENRERIRELFENAIDPETLLVIQIDTAEAHHTGLDVERPDRKDPGYAEELRWRGIARIDGWLQGEYADRVRHAVTIEEMDAWVLADYVAKDTTTYGDPKDALQRALNKKLSEKERRRVFQLEAYARYKELSKSFRSRGKLEKVARLNASLEAFIESLGEPKGDA